jgi:hypothetical protein
MQAMHRRDVFEAAKLETSGELPPEQHLAIAVLRRAVLDAQAPGSTAGQQARQWLAQGEYTLWLEVLGLPASRFERYLASRVGPIELPSPPRPAAVPSPVPVRPAAVPQPAAVPPPVPARPASVPQPVAVPPLVPARPAPPVAPGTLAARFPLGCQVRLSALGEEQLGRSDRQGSYRRRATVVGYNAHDPQALKIARDGLKTVVMYHWHYWERVDNGPGGE